MVSLHSFINTLNIHRRILLVSLILFIPLTNYLAEIYTTLRISTSTEYERNLPLFQAVKANELDKVKSLFNRGSTNNMNMYNPNAEDPQGITPLIEATLLGNYDMVTYLISKGASAQPSPGFRHTALRAACLTANPQLISFLLKNGADPNAKSEGNRTPLMGACFLRPEYDSLENSNELSLKAVELMLADDRTDVLITNSFGESALDLCRERKYTESVAYLEERIKNAQADNNDRGT